MRKFFDEFCGVILCFAFVVIAIGIGSCLKLSDYGNQVDRRREAGRRAFEAGVPPTANPHVGKDSSDAAVWLEGWIDGRQAHEGNPR